MMTEQALRIVKDPANKKITITRNFDAAPQQVWKAWTQSELLDQWWAPKPWRTETKTMDFREGGHWLYAMVGPNEEKHWARVDYLTIDAPRAFTAMDSFCDEQGNKTNELPSMTWRNEFNATDSGTQVVVDITFDSAADLEKIVEMGFETGFTMALDNLEELLRAQA